jgi:hypothetical protein
MVIGNSAKKRRHLAALACVERFLRSPVNRTFATSSYQIAGTTARSVAIAARTGLV